MSTNKERLVSDFYKSDGINYASYDNMRKLPNFVDGLKISQRKLLYVGFDVAYKDYHKTEPFCNIVATKAAYIHGPQNLIGIASLMAAEYVGSNNYSLFTGNDSGFGTRINPAFASGRYTRMKVSDVAKVLFNNADEEILEKQFFEGQYIEPRHLIPIFPIILLNSSEGLSTGFSSSIYSRNPIEVIEYIKKKLAGTEHPRMQLLPWFRGHLGKVAYNKELDRNESFGIVTKNNMTSYTVTELPIGMEYTKYVEFLDKLCENGVIQDFIDKCDPKHDTILFELKTTREFTRNNEDERKLYETLHLIKSLPETLCFIDENNRVTEFKSIYEILDRYIDIRLKYYDMRKQHIVDQLKNLMQQLTSKYIFIKAVIDGKIVINKKKKDEIVAQLEKFDKVIKVDGSYNYLLSMQLYSLTHEKLEELKSLIESKKAELNEVKSTTIQQMWLDDLAGLKKVLK